jgi:hypothetical protein
MDSKSLRLGCFDVSQLNDAVAKLRFNNVADV